MTSLSFPEFKPRAPWWGPDLQTLRNVLIPGTQTAPEHRPKRVEFGLSDPSGDRLIAALEQPEAGTAGPNKPLVVLIHGLGGSQDSSYVVCSARHWLLAGHPVLRLNQRGAGPSGPLCQFSYHAGRTEDLRDALVALSAEQSGLLRGGLALVGYSLGGNMLLKFLGEFGSQFPIRWAATVSAPIDLATASLRFRALRNRGYQRYILASLKRESLRDEAQLTASEIRAVTRAQSVFEFDDHFVAARNGYADAAEYYARNSAKGFLERISCPTLLIHADDDPWIPSSTYRNYDWSVNSNLTPILPGSGGHVGFHDRASRVPWHDRCIAQFALSEKMPSVIAKSEPVP